MKVYKSSDIRNIALAGNAGSGKTTFAESMAFAGKKINRRGSIDARSTLSDYRAVEHEYQGSVYSSVMHTEYDGVKINILDAPGALDFIGASVSSIYASDATIMLLNAQNGVEVGTEIHWRTTERLKKPVIFVINHLDHDNTNFQKTVDEAKETFGNVGLVQYPINPGPNYNAFIDVIRMQLFTWKDENSAPIVSDIPANELEQAEAYRAALIESAAESTDELMEKFFNDGTLSTADMRKGILQGLLSRSFFPMLCASAKKNFGVERIMEFIKNAVPSPLHMPNSLTKDGVEVPCNENGKKSLFIFKTSVEEHLGEVMYFRVMSGTINEGDDLINENNGSKERLSQLFISNGKMRETISSLFAGDIGATVKLKSTKNEHTLNEKGADLRYAGVPYPNPKIRFAVKAKSEANEEKLGEYLHRLAHEDPTYVLEYSSELRQVILHAQGEHHLNTLKWHFDHTYKIDIEFMPPRIPYRETITKAAQADYRHKKQSGGAGQFGEVHMIIDPYEEGKPAPSTFKIDNKEHTVTVRDTQEINLKWGGKLVFYNCIVGGVIDASYMPAIIKGLMEKMEFGPLTGSYARDIRVSVYDGKMHDVDSNEMSFKLAGAKAFSAAFKKAGPKIMEPIYEVEVLVPTDYMGDVMSDLQNRRAIIMGMDSTKGFQIIKARVPLAEIARYATTLSAITGGRATYEMSFLEYAPVPGEIQDKLMKEHVETDAE